ncbi:Shikimate kinase 2 [Pirellulimonas nuda]|uniref:Shikimate kinase n=1 Tax=Pirellulimonas nuda TaxID=2528009 RepID=A0A518D9B8_9BACT|nr:shikimate kinase [Pirellulimonas nuda]QDU88071.1 Shikimate kinase 2 [Pirellulimonas nuda]
MDLATTRPRRHHSCMAGQRDILFLEGYRGVGKSAVARALAARLGWESVDSDDLVEQAAEKSIAEVFAQQGEQAFRALEAGVVISLCERDRCVVALGGGAVLREATREALARSGPVVWLTASAQTIADRLAADPSSGDRRPSLTGQGLLEEITQVLSARESVYRECATFEVDTEGRTPDQVADAIAAFLNR